MKPDRLTIAEVCALLRVRSHSTVYSYVHRGLLPRPRLIGGRSLWDRADVELLLDAPRGLRRRRGAAAR